MKVTISALACLLTLGFEEHDYYPNVESVIVYATGYRAPAAGAYLGHVVEMTSQARLGEAHGNGPIIVSWSDVLDGGRNIADGHNLVLHEFAHKLDFQSGRADGVPRLRTDEEYDRWSEVMSTEYASLVHDAEHNRRTFLDTYGATNPSEFFAVATEAFFEKPIRMRDTHPALYEVLLDFYRQDWARRYEQARDAGEAP